MSSAQEQETKDAAASAAAAGHGPPPEEIAQAIEAARTAASFQDAADSLRKQASVVWDPVEREKLLRSAYLKEKAAHGESKKARVMASGWGQGAGFGVGISTAVGMGAGNLIVALLSGVVAVPGVLIGSGVGAIHGPFIKLKDSISGSGGKKGEGEEKDKLDEKIKQDISVDTDDETDEDIKAHAAIVEAARKLDDEKKFDGEERRKDASVQAIPSEEALTPDAEVKGTEEKQADDAVALEKSEEKSPPDPPKDQTQVDSVDG